MNSDERRKLLAKLSNAQTIDDIKDVIDWLIYYTPDTLSVDEQAELDNSTRDI